MSHRGPPRVPSCTIELLKSSGQCVLFWLRLPEDAEDALRATQVSVKPALSIGWALLIHSTALEGIPMISSDLFQATFDM